MKLFKRKRKAIKNIIMFLAFLLLVSSAYVVSGNYLRKTIAKEVVVEVGSEEGLTSNNFDPSGKFSFVTDISSIPLDKPGEYRIKLRKDIFFATADLYVIDTTAPEGSAQDLKIWLTEKVEIQDFITECKDETTVEYSYEKAPNFDNVGEQDLVILLTDSGGNQAKLNCKLTITEDNEAPLIKGVKEEIFVYQGDTITYRKDVSVSDNRDEDIELKIDSTAVNVQKIGKYKAVYSAVDRAGNESRKTVMVNVIEKKISEDKISEMAGKILDRILKDGMSEREKAETIYYWIRNNTRYFGQPATGDWLSAAYEGFTKFRGDCYVYYGMSRALLTEAGMENIEIVRTDGGHYWNMVNFGEGWYHFDTTPRSTGGTFCLLTDAQLKAYSDKFDGSHLYDTSLYPETPKE
ncbi:transglutaminase domain-containing protein [Alkalibacter mobilis]|uniref:transglutaminase domain-containing protein n=1 Tax=Alkalibacter mobilis TaxID=2787712 RepID=UPI00189FBF8D|nr:transglutaminase domain-containing protein [Alkalibacter mobilis]MBF7097025.1 transglutaminase domain-containing protein [Alkalibacter mobilis]